MTQLHAKPELKVLTFNVGGLSPFGRLTSPENDKRLRGICEELKKTEYDVIFLQEVWTKGYRKLFKNCGYPYSLSKEKISGLELKWKNGLLTWRKLKLIARSFATLFPKNYGFDTGLMILSKYPLTEGKLLRFNENGKEERSFVDGEFPVNKGALGATLKHPFLGDLFLVNTHLVSNYPDEKYLKQREHQLKDILVWIEENKVEKSVIFGGDFNVSPPSVGGEGRHNDSHLLWDKMRHSFLREYRQADLPFGRMSTYISKEGHDEGVLDHLFSQGLKVGKGELAFTDPIKCGKKLCKASDHFGMSTIFY